jgi:hypothetical protein
MWVYAHCGGKNRFSCVSHGRSAAQGCFTYVYYGVLNSSSVTRDACWSTEGLRLPHFLLRPSTNPTESTTSQSCFLANFAHFASVFYMNSSSVEILNEQRRSLAEFVRGTFVSELSPVPSVPYGGSWRPLLTWRCGWPDNSLVEGKFSFYQKLFDLGKPKLPCNMSSSHGSWR